MAATSKNQKPHAIMISFHLQGHIIPFVNLALKLASKGFSITFAHLDFIHHQISKSHYNTTEIDIFAQARSSGLDINYTTISDGFPVEFDRAANFNQHLESFMYKFPDKVDEFVGNLISSSDSNYFLIADTFSIWSAKIAEKYGLVNVSFWTEPALVFSLYYHLDLLKKNGHVPVNGRKEIVDYIPGIPSINTKDFMSYFQDSDLQLLHKIIFRAFDVVKSADFILCNTVHELEIEIISALQQKQPFYSIGPIFPADFSKTAIARSLLPESNSDEWLNSKSPGSVLYVSFGSLAKIDKKVIFEIAGGLLLSEVNFIWVIRPGIVDFDSGAVESSDRRVLDALWVEFGAGERVVWCSDDLDEVKEKIGILMSGKRSDELRKEIGKVRKILESALTKDGSSERNFDCFVEDVSDEIFKKCKKM
ncbi:hypothetical protein DH2020_026158 [Rehmannia glutinosa]|uniref:Uncharacterized protein n=1 Tax=Rehmannia glutinosa TaxID=99300 RepID=A0ABR0W1I5_REHGL